MVDEVRAVDASVLLRYLLNDLPELAERSRGLVDSDTPLGLTVVALSEAAWTMTSPRHRRDRQLVAQALLGILQRDNSIPVGFERLGMQEALRGCAAPVGAPDFGDAFIAACCNEAGISQIYSFDQRFARTGMTPVPPPLR